MEMSVIKEDFLISLLSWRSTSISPLCVVPPDVTPANDLGNQNEDSQDNEEVSDGDRVAWI